MSFSATTKWIALALLGLAIAAAVAIAASNLVSRQIGIASESVSAGDALAPAVESAARQVKTGNGGNDGGANPANTPPATTAEPGDDNGGGSEPGTPSADSDRADEEQDALEDRLDEEEDARDDREDALEDLEDDSGGGDNSGHGSDD